MWGPDGGGKRGLRGSLRDDFLGLISGLGCGCFFVVSDDSSVRVCLFERFHGPKVLGTCTTTHAHLSSHFAHAAS